MPRVPRLWACNLQGALERACSDTLISEKTEKNLSSRQLCEQRRRSQVCHDEAPPSKSGPDVSHIVYAGGVDADLSSCEINCRDLPANF